MRVAALALIRRGNDLLVERGYDSVKGEMFYRLLGGTIEEGELGADAVRRELLEELGVEVEVGGRLATIENIFTWEGKPWHEIVLVYACSLDDDALPDGEWKVPEGDVVHEVCWKRVSDFGSHGDRLYPEELLTLLDGTR
jgi:ADP-ribose pyrophosphatase YjhB (NUDIX family)